MNEKEFDFEALRIELKNRNPQAIRYLFDLYYKPLAAYALELIRGSSKAYSITRDALNGVVENIANFTSFEEVRTFLYRRVHEECDRCSPGAELWRALNKNNSSDQESILEGEILAQLYENVQKLPRQRRFAINLLFFCGVKSKEAANLMGISRQTVLNHKNRAIEQLQQAFEKKGPFTAVFLIGLPMLFLLQF
jgi:RNA polymerase sigma factor (sigma-70 family)